MYRLEIMLCYGEGDSVEVSFKNFLLKSLRLLHGKRRAFPVWSQEGAT